MLFSRGNKQFAVNHHFPNLHWTGGREGGEVTAVEFTFKGEIVNKSFLSVFSVSFSQRVLSRIVALFPFIIILECELK